MAFDLSSAQELSQSGSFDLNSASPVNDEPKKKRTVGDIISDVGITGLKGAVGLPQSFVGLADIPTGGRVGKALDSVGVRFGDAQQMLDGGYSDAQQEANRKVHEADGFVDTMQAAIDNPSVIATTVGESIPQMLGGAGIAKGVMKAAPKVAPWLAGAVGEGVIGAGSAAESIREQSGDGLLTAKQSLSAVGSGAGTAAFGALGGKLAQQLKFADVDTMLAQGGANAVAADAAKKGFIRQVVESGISEGAFEELPQSMQEQMWQNFATDKPLTEGVGNAAALGLLAGGLMGGAGGGYNAIAGKQVTQPKPNAPLENASNAGVDQLVTAGDYALDGSSILLDDTPATSPQSASTPLPSGALGRAAMIAKAGILSQGSTGFGAVSELGDFVAQEKSDLELQRANIAAQQEQSSALRMESDLESTDARAAGASEAQARQSRLDALDSIYANPDERTPGMSFLAHLEANHQNNPIPTPEEKRIIAQREQAYQAFRNMPEEKPFDFGIPEKAAQPTVERSDEQKFAQVDAYLANGYKPSVGGSRLVNGKGKMLFLNSAQQKYLKDLPQSSGITPLAQPTGTAATSPVQNVAPPIIEPAIQESAPVAQLPEVQNVGTATDAGASALDTAGSADGTGSTIADAVGSDRQFGDTPAAMDGAGQGGAVLDAGTESGAVADQIKPIVEQLVKMRRNAGQVRLAPQLDIAVNKAKAAIKSGTGKAADFTKLAKVFKGKDTEIHAALLSIADTLKPAQEPKKPQKASTDLLQRIKQLGGIDGALALDITGEQRAPGGWKFAFNKGGTGLDDLATMLASDGFMIDTSDVDGGVQQLRDMIRNHIGGERNFKAQTQEAQGEAMSASRDMDAMMQRADELGIKWKNLNAQQLSDAVYEAEDALEMERLDAEELSDAGIAATDAIVDEEVEIAFGDEAVTDNAALQAWLGEDDEQTTGGNTGKGAGTRTQEGSGTVGGAGRQEAGTGQEVLQSYTSAEVAQREAAQAAQERAQRDEAAKAKAEQAAKDQAAVDAKIKARTDNPDNFQFGENSKQAAAPVADLFNQPAKQEAAKPDVPETTFGNIERISGNTLETNLPEVEHVTGKGKTLKGVITKTLTKEQAKAIDKFTWKKDGGYFIRAEHLKRISGEPEKAAPAAAAEPKPTDTRFTGNKLFTADKVAEARARMKKKLGTLNSGFDPELMNDGITIAGAYIESGARSFAAYSKAMVEDFGDAIKPYLRSFYEGVRHYPGIDNSGMTSPAVLDAQEAEAKKPQESASPAIGTIEPRAPRSGIKSMVGAKLKDDYGVTQIDGYDNETGEGASGAVKREFLKDSKKYLEAVAAELAGRGFAPFTDRKGKPGKPVSVNESGIATSGDITLTMLHESGKGIYLTIGGTSLRGAVPTTKSGVSVMMRVNSKGDQWGGDHNRWMPVNLTASELADAAENAVAQAVNAGAAVQQKRDTALAAGKAAFEEGKTRNVPIEYVTDKEAGRLWAQGWDTANIAAPIENTGEEAQNEIGGGDNARPTQPESVSASTARPDPEGRTGGDRAGEPLDAGMAEAGGGTDRGGRVRGGVSEPTGAGAQPAGEGNGVQPSDQNGVVPVLRADRRAADTELNHTIEDADEIGTGGATAKFRDNVAAIKILKALDAENRKATPDERKALARYVGFGALKGAFDPDNKAWAKQYAELRELLTDEEFASARASILNAHYTSPVVVKAMYQAVEQMGFKGGRVLEPSVGSGNFFGMMPAALRNASKLHGVELDLLTSKLAKALYPKANIAVATGFQDYQVPAGFFDMAIGNPPFGSESVPTTERTAYSKFSIHNYFIARMIDKVRDGGIVPVIVSHNFMDAIDPKARAWVAERANLLGAVRLPNTAFKQNAGTEVVTDILFFQKTATPERNPAWVNSSDTEINGERISINDYFQRNKQNILGTETTTSSMYRANEYTVDPIKGESLEDRLIGFVNSLPANVYTAVERTTDELDSADNTIPDGVKQGSYFINSKGEIRQRGNDIAGAQTSTVWTPKNATAEARMRGMMQLRDLLRAQMRMERDVDTDAKAIERHRKELNAAYDAFLKKYGYVNSQTNRGIFIDDTEAALLQSIEFDYDKGISKAVAEKNDLEERAPSATKADILTRRVLFPVVEKMNVETAKDALLSSLDAKGSVDLGFMERAYNKPRAAIVVELGEILYQDPASGDYAMADEYLSGDVKTKLAEAKKAANENHDYSRNVAVLEAVIPADKLPSEIFASIGAGWVPADVFKQFAEEITGSKSVELNYLAATAQWFGEIRDGGDIGKMRSDYGTDKLSSFELFNLLLNGRAPEIKKRIMRDGKEAYVTDEEATEAAREKAAKIKQAWESWVWADGERSESLAALYNDKHNRTVNRRFDGSHLVLHGSNPAIVLRAHQKDAVWRMVQDRNTLLDHVVGAGKTFAMAAATMEMKRLGIARKPIIVVPNHLTMQWRSDFSRLYPSANVLAATPEDFSKGNRERMFSKIALGDYDAVIIGHSSLTKIGLDPKIETEMIQEQIDEIADAIEGAKKERGDKRVVSDMEKIKKNLEAKVADLVAKAGQKDKVVTFDELGVDAMLIDEMHEFKNLFFVTQKQRVSGLGNPKGSGKAFDLFAKVRWMQKTFGEKAPLITATGTPVSNSLAEMFTMQRYMRFDELKRDGLHLFDSWSRMFGEDEYVYEVAPSGVGYRISQRFSKFKNLPALMAHYRGFADTVTLQDLKDQAASEGKRFPVPKIVGGKPQNIVAKRSDLQRDFFGIPKVRRDESGNTVYGIDYQAAKIEQNNEGKWILSDGHSSSHHLTKEDAELSLVERALSPVLDLDENSLLGKFANLKELTRKTKGKINALSLTSLASKAGLDMRLIYPSAPDFAGSKINQAVTNMLRTYKQWEADKGTQLVFCDMSIPLSARAAMGSKERRLYVLDDYGTLTHKKGTLHTVEGFDGFPFYLVKTGKAESQEITAYDPITGARIKGGFSNKADAKAWVADFLGKDENRDKWYEMRETREAITPEQIEEYREQNDLELAEDGSNEVSMDDLEAISGAAGFSVYDDIKAKLIAAGVPENEIAFIHDYDTPKKKQELFKRTNRGDVRFLLGSTPKLGAGTNVQERIVGLHHIDAPWRPSDLEQREGRGIRQGNALYERNPDGFELFIGRYSTEQTYDTRRWQLLEHKASGIEQLRKYSGEAEIEDVAGEAANAADMKAAASGNPLILEETKLRTEVKRLTAQQKGHSYSTYAMQKKLSHERNRVATFLPQKLEAVKQAIAAAKANPARTGKDEIGNIIVDGKNIKIRAAAEEAIATAAQKVRGNLGRSVKEIVYRGILFELDGGGFDAPMTLYTPTGEYGSYSPKENVSASGMLTRFENYIDSLEQRQARFEAEIEQAKKDIASIEERIHAPFADAATLETAKADHAKVQRRLMKSTQIDAVPVEERAAFTKELAERKKALAALGYETALRELDSEAPLASRGQGSGQTVASIKQATQALRSRWLGFRKIEIVQHDSDLPQEFTERVLRSGGELTGSEGWFDPKTKTVYLVADNLESPERAVWVAAHEVAGHGGVRMLDRSVAEALEFSGKNGFVQKLAKEIAADRGETFNAKTHTDEALAELSAATITGETDAILTRYGVKVPAGMRSNLIGMIKRVADAVRKFMAQVLGKKVDAVSDAEVYGLLRQMRAAVEGKADTEAQADDGYALASRAPTTPQQGNIPLQGGQTGNPASWDSPEASKLDNIIYTLQDKHIDMKRVVEAIKEAGGNLIEKFNPYLAEELFHGRAAKRTQDFVNTELKPLIADLRMRGLDIDALDQYLHARHAKEANDLIAQRDPNMPDGGSGMTNQEVDDYFANLPADKQARLAAAAKRVDDIITKTRDLYVSYGLVSKDQADSWAQMFQHYVPLMREDNDGGMGIGQGFSIKGKEVKHRTGSTAKVVDILANIALQREKAITRGEKNRVAVALAGLVKLNPNPDFWSFGRPPIERVLNEKTGLVEERIDPTFKSKPNVVVAKIKDSSGQVQERAVIFNERDERAVRMAEAFKNLDAVQLGGVMGVSAMITRYFASINTQYNPIFGIVNIVRDVQGMALNLGSTPIAQHRADVIKLIPSAVKGIYQDSRAEREGHAASSKWAQMWEELQDEGGMTGYRDLYRNSEDRANSIKHELDPYQWHNNMLGKVFTANGALKVPLKIAQNRAGWLFDWLSDYNQTLEGATRLATYKVARDNGMTKQQAASLAKNITVNFNRKGHIGQQAGAMYAFFNAAMQGSARIAQTMLTYQDGKVGLTATGKAIVYGGITLGALQALMLAAAGFDDDEPPEFVRERALILPIGNKKYLTLPMPLGFHVFPNIGRIPTEWALNGFKDTPERIIHLLGTTIEAFNPLGSAGMSLQTIMPTALDPFTALAENKDWTGKPIYKDDFNSMKPTPGFERNKDTATAWSKGIAEALNYMSGGTDYVPGAISPTADQIDYLIAQATGGVGREVSKVAQAGGSVLTGEELPPHKMPLVGRFYGDSSAQSSQGNAYYANLKRINEVEAEIKGRRDNREPIEDYKQDNPEWKLIGHAKVADKIIRNLRKQKRELIENDAPREKIKAIEDKITAEMQRLNEVVRKLEEKEAA